MTGISSLIPTLTLEVMRMVALLSYTRTSNSETYGGMLKPIVWASYGLNCGPPPLRTYVIALTPGTLKCDHIWGQGLQRRDEVKMRPPVGYSPNCLGDYKKNF